MPAEDQIVPECPKEPDMVLELNGKKLTLSLDSLTDWVGLTGLATVVGLIVLAIVWVAV